MTAMTTQTVARQERPPRPVSAKDVALYILETEGQMGTMKLQKLVFYSQAYSLAWFNEPIFHEDVEAWIHGPVIRGLWRLHRRLFSFSANELKEKAPDADSSLLTPNNKRVIRSILKSVGALSGLDLRDRTHEEAPWIDAFDVDADEHKTVITHQVMQKYYSAHA